MAYLFEILHLPRQLRKVIYIIYWYYSNSYQSVAVVRSRGSVHGGHRQAWWLNASDKQLLVFLRAECSLTSKNCSRRQGGRSCEHLLMENPKDIGHCNCRYLSTALRYRRLSGRVLFCRCRCVGMMSQAEWKDLWISNFGDLLNSVCVILAK